MAEVEKEYNKSGWEHAFTVKRPRVRPHLSYLTVSETRSPFCRRFFFHEVEIITIMELSSGLNDIILVEYHIFWSWKGLPIWQLFNEMGRD